MRDAECYDCRLVYLPSSCTGHVKVTATAKKYWSSHALAGCGRRCATPSKWTGSLSQLATQGDTLSAVRFLMICLAWRRSWICFRPISFERRVQKADDAISHGLWASMRHHWRPLTSQMLACSQLKSFRLPYAVLMLIAIYRLSP